MRIASFRRYRMIEFETGFPRRLDLA